MGGASGGITHTLTTNWPKELQTAVATNIPLAWVHGCVMTPLTRVDVAKTFPHTESE